MELYDLNNKLIYNSGHIFGLKCGPINEVSAYIQHTWYCDDGMSVTVEETKILNLGYLQTQAHKTFVYIKLIQAIHNWQA